MQVDQLTWRSIFEGSIVKLGMWLERNRRFIRCKELKFLPRFILVN